MKNIPITNKDKWDRDDDKASYAIAHHERKIELFGCWFVPFDSSITPITQHIIFNGRNMNTEGIQLTWLGDVFEIKS